MVITDKHLIVPPNLGALTIHPRAAIDAAAIFGSFKAALDERELLKPGEKVDPHFISITDKLGVGCDALEGGMFRLSIYVAGMLSDLIDWEQYNGGVFSYEYLERRPDFLDLSQYLFASITDEAWGDIAGNWLLPSKVAMAAALSDWAMTVGLTLSLAGWQSAPQLDALKAESRASVEPEDPTTPPMLARPTLLNLYARIEAAKFHVEAMKAHNDRCKHEGSAPFYTEAEFTLMACQMEELAAFALNSNPV